MIHGHSRSFKHISGRHMLSPFEVRSCSTRVLAAHRVRIGALHSLPVFAPWFTSYSLNRPVASKTSLPYYGRIFVLSGLAFFSTLPINSRVCESLLQAQVSMGYRWLSTNIGRRARSVYSFQAQAYVIKTPVKYSM